MISIKKERKNYRYYAFIVGLWILVFRDWIETFISIFTYADELVALSGVAVYLIKTCISGKLTIWSDKKSKAIIISLFVFILSGLAGSIINQYQTLNIVISQMFLSIKFWLAFFLGASCFDIDYLRKFSISIKRHILLIMGIIIISCIPDLTKVFGGTFAVKGLFRHQTVLVANCILLLALAALFGNCENKKGVWQYIVVLGCLIVCSGRSKGIAAVVLTIFLYLFIIRRKKKIKLIDIILLVAVAVFIAWDKISYYFIELQDESARYKLYEYGWKILLEYFPFGSGFGTFATYYSGVSYSSLYYHYELNAIWGLQEGGSFISDTFWPAILGETGFIGTLAYLTMIFVTFISIQRLAKTHWRYYFAGVMLLIYLLISSSSEAAFYHPIAIPMAVILGMLYRRQKFEKSLLHRNLQKEKLKIGEAT